MSNNCKPFSKEINLSETRYRAGMKVRRAVLGDAHVNKATARATSLDRDFQRYIAEAAWGSVWSREGLSRRERSLITIAMLAGLGHEEELAMHLRAAIDNTGTSLDDIREVLLQVGVYCGVPHANTAFKIAKEVLGQEIRRAETTETA
ncbi:4-carboxymuconolactone decarboxylase [Microbulbifer taiwanensis]|uniref:4-carboxymuconolactone decarboxylase n=1 Tax=Microbulbifer taiwanensis TaxID=986746 RepID=UPI0029C0C8CA|nr:4-carboxymuconolactone decarboxylase [Microbulbifer taiwanensis]